MPKFDIKNPYIFFIILIIVTRIIYTGIGVFTRDVLMDNSKPFPAWTHNSQFQALNVWTIWDSGYYSWIATDGYPDNIGDKNTTQITVPQNTYIKLYLAGGHLPGGITLPGGKDNIKTTNALFLIGSTQKTSSVEIKGITAGLPYCIYKGPIEYDRDVVNFRNVLVDINSCGETPCDEAILTYFNAAESKVIYQEKFTADNFEIPTTLIGNNRPDGFTNMPFEGLGCKSIEKNDLYATVQFDYTKQASPYPFFPAYPYATRLLNVFFQNIFLSGVLLSNLMFIVAAIFLYKLIKLDFDQKIAFYTTIFYIVYPFNFILSGFFTEGLFNALLFLSLYLARTKKYIPAVLVATILPATRVTGIFLLPMLLIIFIRQIKNQTKLVKLSLFAVLTFPLLLLAHMNHLYSKTGDYFAFYRSQSAWGRELGGTFISNIINYIGHAKGVAYFELIVLLTAIALALVAIIKVRDIKGKQIPLEYIFFAIISCFLPILTGILQSSPRYSLTIFPIYIGITYLAIKQNLLIQFAWISFLLSCILMGVWAAGTLFIV